MFVLRVSTSYELRTIGARRVASSCVSLSKAASGSSDRLGVHLAIHAGTLIRWMRITATVLLQTEECRYGTMNGRADRAERAADPMVWDFPNGVPNVFAGRLTIL